MLTAAGLDIAFELVVTADDVGAPKPSPASYLHALAVMSRRRPAEAAQTLAVEDGWIGIASAREAGLRCIAIGRLAPYRALQTNGLVPSLRGHTLDTLERLASHPREYIA
jgi:beta-phosphoglucomutase-like phosphatase (HAD superfamily)